MAEYIELNELQKFCRKYTEVDAVGLILANRTDLLPPADVIERSEYEYLKKENRELAIKYDNAMNMVINEQENVTRLRSKVDKAIEEIEELAEAVERVTSSKKIRSEDVLEILKGI